MTHRGVWQWLMKNECLHTYDVAQMNVQIQHCMESSCQEVEKWKINMQQNKFQVFKDLSARWNCQKAAKDSPGDDERNHNRLDNDLPLSPHDDRTEDAGKLGERRDCLDHFPLLEHARVTLLSQLWGQKLTRRVRDVTAPPRYGLFLFIVNGRGRNAPFDAAFFLEPS